MVRKEIAKGCQRDLDAPIAIDDRGSTQPIAGRKIGTGFIRIGFGSFGVRGHGCFEEAGAGADAVLPADRADDVVCLTESNVSKFSWYFDTIYGVDHESKSLRRFDTVIFVSTNSPQN